MTFFAFGRAADSYPADSAGWARRCPSDSPSNELPPACRMARRVVGKPGSPWRWIIGKLSLRKELTGRGAEEGRSRGESQRAYSHFSPLLLCSLSFLFPSPALRRRLHFTQIHI